MLAWKIDQQIGGLWEHPPQMVTATLDDSIGQGLKMIHCFSDVAGVKVTPLGLMQPPEVIVSTCRQLRPDMLGMTVLQFDSLEMLDEIVDKLSAATQVIVGGSAFRQMSAAQLREKPYRVLSDVAAYVEFLLSR